MLLPLAYYGDSILRQKARPVDQIDTALRTLVAHMIETMHHHKGAGLAAPQVHQSLAVIIIHIPEYDEDKNPLPTPEQVFINPTLLEVSTKNWIQSEGCLSVPGIYEEIERPVTVKAEVTTLDEERKIVTFTGWEARAFLHENDHLNGVFFFDRLRGKKRAEMEAQLRQIKKKYSGKTRSRLSKR